MRDPKLITLVVDVFLAIANAWHLFIVAAFLHPVESPLKKPLVDGVEKILKRCPPHHVVASFAVPLFAFASFYGFWGYMHHQDKVDDAFPMLLRGFVGALTFMCALVLMKLTSTLLTMGKEKVLEYELEMEKKLILSFTPPPVSLFDAVVAPQDVLMKPDVNGIDNVPTDKPSLFVMNHSLSGMDMPVTIRTLYKEKNVFPRGLADHIHFATPTGMILRRMGAVDGTRANVDVLMESKQSILVYPGGGPEILKHSSVPKYALLWKERVGFARMAIKHSYQIVPCAAIGLEDMIDVVGDIPTGYNGYTIPVMKTSPSRLQKMYLWFGKPISTSEYKGDSDNTEFAKEVRDKTRNAILSGMEEMKRKQENDPERFLTQQIKKSLSSLSATNENKVSTRKKGE
jgi:1-acyl-sn-glycerol-3-phosphate acyltransferase